ncbi:MAG: pentapeptide repeat-containing protein, partial [Pseudanabaenales cyanobacterium]|nr:pentapeptide repeat-containing protein [Pseudanabaenales cyanobacterium]
MADQFTPSETIRNTAFFWAGISSLISLQSLREVLKREIKLEDENDVEMHRALEVLLHEEDNSDDDNIDTNYVVRLISSTSEFKHQVGILLLRKLISRSKKLNGLHLHNLSFSGVSFANAKFCGFDFSGVDLSGTDLSQADFSGANLEGANLSRADLRQANLSSTDLNGANLEGAILNQTDLSGAKLEEAVLDRVDLRSAKL